MLGAALKNISFFPGFCDRKSLACDPLTRSFNLASQIVKLPDMIRENGPRWSD